LRGVIQHARVRAPFTPVDAETLKDLDDILARLNLLGRTANSEQRITNNE